MSRRFVIWLVAAVLGALVTGTTFADTSLVERGVRGSHRLTDTGNKPGAACQFGAVGGGLQAIIARPPLAFATDRTSANDSEWISVRARLEAQSGTSWSKVATSSWETALATESVSPFTSWHEFHRPGSGRFRVIWEIAWFGNGTDAGRTGFSRHLVDNYSVRVGGWVEARVSQGGCDAPRHGAPAVSVNAGSRNSPQVALTFDMGGRIGDAVEIVEWLDSHAVPATIFITGQAASTSAGQDIMAIAAAAPDRLALGNHSWSHPDFTKLTAAEIADQLTSTDDLLQSSTGRSTRPYFRPPYGRLDGPGRAAVGATGWSLSVLWDVTTNDYTPPRQGGPTPSELRDTILGRVQNGSIVLMHLGGYSDLEALPEIVAGLEARGLEPVTLEELLDL